MTEEVDFRLDVSGDNPIRQYPDIRAAEMEQLEWHVVGAVRIAVDGVLITKSPLAENGYVDDYLWMHAKKINSAISSVAADDSVEFSLSDNPGTFELISRNGELLIRFDSRTRDKQVAEARANETEFYRAVIDGTEELINSLEDINPELRGADLMTDLEAVVVENRRELL